MKTKKRYKYFATFVMMALLFGCSELNSSKTATPSLAAHEKINTTTPDVTTPPLAVTSSPVAETVPVCQGKGKHFLVSNDAGISGTIIYQNDDSTGLYTLSGTPITISKVLSDETQKNVVFGFSPDGQWLAYSPFDASSDAKFEQMEVILLAADGEKIEHVLSTKEFEDELQVGHQLVGVSGYSYWINANMIYVTLYSQNPDPSTSGYIRFCMQIAKAGKWRRE